MGATVELPVWLVAGAGLLALIGLIDRLLIPTVRWVLRRRVNAAIDELNQRLKLRIQPFKLTQRQSLIDRLVYDHEVIRAVEAHAAATGEPRAVTMSRVETYAREIVPAFNAEIYFRVGSKLARLISTALYRVRLGYSHDEALRAIDPDAAVIFVMNHRSNMDYVLVTYLASASSALSYAVGEWARVVFLQQLIRSMGAYMIRRDSRDPLYRRVLARYVHLATSEGVTQALFPEGGLTRDGAMRPAKLGLLSYIVGRFDPADERDIVFVPVGVNYDRVIEDRNLTAELARGAGGTPPRRGAGAVTAYVATAIWRRLAGHWYRFGYASVSFGDPVSLRAWVAHERADFDHADEATRFAGIERLAGDLMAAIARVVPVLPVPLAATILLEAEGPLTAIEIKARIVALIERLKARGVHVHVPREDLDYAAQAGLRMLTLRRLVIETDGHFRAAPDGRVLLRYYANSIAHHLAEPAPAPDEFADIAQV
jgi:glycerol-3-phosphate O-acyltransferase